MNNGNQIFNVTQRTQYYAHGLPYAEGTGISTQPNKYNGKEFIEMHGYDEYDLGFRSYYPALGRFTTIDPLSELSYSTSPYAFAGNNSMNNIDIMGLAPIQPHELNYTVVDKDGKITKNLESAQAAKPIMCGSKCV